MHAAVRGYWSYWSYWWWGGGGYISELVGLELLLELQLLGTPLHLHPLFNRGKIENPQHISATNKLHTDHAPAPAPPAATRS